MENFPIPLELREQIYGYLIGDTASQPLIARRKYRFHACIFGVNRTINAEAKAVMLRENDFIEVRHKSAELRRLLRMLGLPFVAKKCGEIPPLRSMCSMRVGIRGPEYEDTTKLPIRRLYVLGRDLNRLVNALRLLFSGGMQDESLWADGWNLFSHKDITRHAMLKIELLPVGRRIDNHWLVEHEKSLLLPFMKCSSPRMAVRVKGSTNDQSNAVLLAAQIGGEKVWLEAFLWDMVDLIRALSLDVSAAIERGGIEEASLIVDIVIEYTQSWTSAEVATMVFTELRMREPFARWMVAVLDLASWSAAQQLPSNFVARYERLVEWIQKLCGALSDGIDKNGLALLYFDDVAGPGLCSFGRKRLEVSSTYVELYPALPKKWFDAFFFVCAIIPDEDMLLFDGDTLEEITDLESRETWQQRMNARNWAPKMWMTAYLDGYKVPQGLEGWVDVAAERSRLVEG